MDAHQELHPHGGDWLSGIVFGLNDGLVTTLVFIMAASSVTHEHLLLVALSEVLAGGISMALGGYLSTTTEAEILDHRIATERYEIEQEPEEERAELRTIYRRKGLHGGLLEQVVGHLTADRDRWLRSMVHDELGIVEGERERPWLDALLVGGSFVAGGLVPTVPLLVGLPRPQLWAYGLTALAAVVLGAIKSRYTSKAPVRAAAEFLLIVTLGTLAGVGIGALLHAM